MSRFKFPEAPFTQSGQSSTSCKCGASPSLQTQNTLRPECIASYTDTEQQASQRNMLLLKACSFMVLISVLLSSFLISNVSNLFLLKFLSSNRWDSRLYRSDLAPFSTEETFWNMMRSPLKLTGSPSWDFLHLFLRRNNWETGEISHSLTLVSHRSHSCLAEMNETRLRSLLQFLFPLGWSDRSFL